MAYMTQEHKKQLAPAINDILKEYGVKGTLAVRHHMTLVLNIKSGEIDFFGDCRHSTVDRGHMQINTYWFQDHFTDDALEFLNKILPAMNVGNHNNSDVMTDYFDVGWYVDINIGQWDKDYILKEMV
jgi:hypothetical protein